MNLTCWQCHHPIEDNGAGDWIHSQSQDAYCEYRHTHDPSNRPVAKPASPSSTKGPDRLGCPRCGGDDLLTVSTVYEPIWFFTDGHHDYPDSPTDYGRVLAVICGGSKCDWEMGSVPLDERLDLNDFVEEHKAAIRAEILKEMASG